ncbi:universal stress protein [Mycobacterium decipiens]|uniref:Universal stress protein n=1 Tax=Mycobacterium decipiens TaxID=1430326 RepID=A0A1X2LU94_9MYCO|nr:universal stress protein [Mycobacterium decipiens]OSC40536.1 universal stress protein [Mycobacterium decipiens]
MPVGVIVGYDGSPAANAAIDAGALLFPGAHGWITYLWVPPFASDRVRHRLRAVARDTNELSAMVEREGEHQAQRLVAMGVTLARTAGWDAEPLLKRTWGAEGLRFAQVVEEVHADLVLVGSRGLGGTQAVLGSISDMVVHYSVRPVVVVPHPMLATEYEALPEGPVLVGWDGSPGAETAFTAAGRVFPERDVLPVFVSEDTGATPSRDNPSGMGAHEVLQLHADRRHGSHARAVSEALVAAAADRGAAALVVGSRGRSTARKILLGSVALGALHHSHCPVMVVPSAWKDSSSGAEAAVAAD